MKNADVETLSDTKIAKTTKKEISSVPETPLSIIIMTSIAFALVSSFMILIAFIWYLMNNLESEFKTKQEINAVSETITDIGNIAFFSHPLTAIVVGLAFLLAVTIWIKLDAKATTSDYLYRLENFFPTIDARQHEFINSMKKFHFSLKQPERDLPLGYRWINTANGHKSLQEGNKSSNSLYGSHQVFETLVSDGHTIYLKRDYIKPMSEQWDSVFGMIENEVKQEIAANKALRSRSEKTPKVLSLGPLEQSHQRKRSFFGRIR